MKRIFTFILSLFVTISIFPAVGVQATVKSTSDAIVAEKNKTNVTIGNEYISREFSIEDNKLVTNKLVNLRTGSTPTEFVPESGNEEFIIRTVKESDSIMPSVPHIDRSSWTAKTDSYNNATGPNDGNASNLIDGDLNSIWHTNYGGGSGSRTYPYNVTFNLNEKTSFKSFSYVPRQQSETVNGNVKGYQLFISNSQKEPEFNSTEWTKVAEGDFKYNGTGQIFVNLNEEVEAKYVKFVATSANNGANFAGGSEFYLHSEEQDLSQGRLEREFAASDLELDSDNIIIEDTNVVINNIDKTGKKITFPFKPYIHKNVEYSINQVIVMYEGDHFMRKFLEISVPNDQKELAVIDYIDLESFEVGEDVPQWTIPKGQGGVVSLNEYRANLGQPIYIQGMFFGSEFPVSDTQIEDGTGHIRYYSGKSFDRLEKDNQLTDETERATYVTWQTVAGSSRSTEVPVIQADFFDYINSIATPSDFRLQYNSWFDNMMLIDDENILESFIEVDREMNKTEVRPLDSYVVDDGFNNYNNKNIVDANRSGTTLNKSGFWEFNTKFPDGFGPSSELVNKFGSDFGVWIGPRGGYNFYGHLADLLTNSGKGSKAGGSVDVADRNYVKNLQDMFIGWQKEYGVNYWKWDGFADDSQFGQFPQVDGVPGYANNHMTGGKQGMYHNTDLWEAWIDVMEAARGSEIEDEINKLWISLTCYVNLSPWHLQWANSVWLQCVGDRGESGHIHGKMDKMLTYRDANYYDFIVNHEFQFPLSNIYNHDPIYGTEGTGLNINSMTSEEFKNYLYFMAARGTGFWELYYSDSIFTDEKYEINAEFLEWAESKYHILRNAKIIGGNPADGVKLNSGPSTLGNGGDAYGFSAWDKEEGIISMRNSDNKPKEITFKLDRNIGLSESLKGKTINRVSVHNFKTIDGSDNEYKTLKYGDTVTLILQPGEVRIWELSPVKDQKAPEIVRLFTDGDKTLTIKFDEKVTGSNFKVEGNEVASVYESADGITYKVRLKNEVTSGTSLNVSSSDIVDLSGNKLSSVPKSVVLYKENLVYSTELEGQSNDLLTSFNFNNGFSVFAEVNTEQTGVLVNQENGYTLSINEDGYAVFTLNGAKAVGSVMVNDGVDHVITGVKENNGILKLYVDGELDASGYVKENRYLNINSSTTSLGNSGFEGTLKVSFFDYAYGYDLVPTRLETELDRQPLPHTDFSVEVSNTSEGSKENLFDNNPTTFWTSEEKSTGIAKGNPYVTVDLGGEFIVDRIDYTKRYFNGPENHWKCTGNLHTYVIETSDDGGETWKVVSQGRTFDDKDITTNKEGGTTAINFSPTKASHIRISGTESYHWQQQNVNKYMTVADLAIYGEPFVLENIALNNNSITASNVDGSDVGLSNDRPLTMITDGAKVNSSFYGEFGKDNTDKASYIELDLGKTSYVNQINLYRYFLDGRVYNGTVISLSNNADHSENSIVYNADTSNKFGFGAGTDATYAESAAGRTFAFNDFVKTRYVRVYMNGSNKGTTNHIVELEVMGYQVDSPEVVDYGKLNAKLVEVKALDANDFTTSSYTALAQAIMLTEEAIKENLLTQTEVDALLISLSNVQAELVNRSKGLNANEILAEITALNLREEDYTTQSWILLETAKNSVIETLADLSDVTDSQLQTLLNELGDALAGLVEVDVEVEINYDELINKVSELKLFDAEIYTTSSFAPFVEAIKAAELAILENTSTQVEVNALLVLLTDLQTKLVKRTTGLNANEVLTEIALLNLKADDYSSHTWIQFQVAYEALKALVKDFSNVTDTQLQQAIDELKLSLDSLEPVKVEVNYDAIIAKLTELKALDESEYTSSSFAYLSESIISTEFALELNTITQDEVNALLSVLINVEAGLIKRTTGLNANEILAEISAMNLLEKDFTSETWNTFRLAYSTLVKLIEDLSDVSDAQLQSAIYELKEAVLGLVKVEEEPEETIPWTPIEPSNPIEPQVPVVPEGPESENKLPPTGVQEKSFVAASGIVLLGILGLLENRKRRNKSS